MADLEKKPQVIEEDDDKKVIDLAKEEDKQNETPAAPAKAEQYIRFNSGDSIESIAEKYGTTVEKIIERNKINPHPTALGVGHWLWV